MALAEVCTLYETNMRSIPAMFRQAADSIEQEAGNDDASPTTAVVVIQLSADGGVEVYGWGDTSDMHALGMLERGKHELLSILAGYDG